MTGRPAARPDFPDRSITTAGGRHVPRAGLPGFGRRSHGELAFIDSGGMHAIVNAGIGARQAGRRLVLVRVPSNVERTFMLTGSSDQVEIRDVGPVAPPGHALQRSLVSRSPLMSDGHREPGR